MRKTNYKGGHVLPLLSPRKLRRLVRQSVQVLRRYKFDAIAFRGMSGAILASTIALEMGKPLLLVRKQEDSTHSVWEVEGDYAARSFVVVDDFVSTGDTVRAIIEKTSRNLPGTNCIGTLEVVREFVWTPVSNPSVVELSRRGL